MIKRILKLSRDPRRLLIIALVHFGGFLPDAIYLRLIYYLYIGKRLNLKNPKTFNEKLQWLKLHDRNPEYTTMVDKVEAKKWVAERIGEQYIIPTLGVWDRAEDIDFDALPDQFVLKTNHDSGGVVVCKDKNKLDRNLTQKKMARSLKRDFYAYGREWPYKNVPHKILAEQFIPCDDPRYDNDLPDYKFMCFDGKVECCFVCTDRHSEDGVNITIFDREWNLMPFKRPNHPRRTDLKRPKLYSKMIELAEILAKGTKFLRVDFYEVGDTIYWGELTLYPGCGFEKFSPEEWDYKLGKLIKL